MKKRVQKYFENFEVFKKPVKMFKNCFVTSLTYKPHTCDTSFEASWHKLQCLLTHSDNWIAKNS